MVDKHLNIEDIQRIVHFTGYHILSKSYSHHKEKLKWKCPEGHTFELSWNAFQMGQRCPHCFNTKLTIETIKAMVAIEGYNLESDKYVNNKYPLELKCPEGHIFTTTWARFVSGHRCPMCAGSKKQNLDFIAAYLFEIGYTLVSKKYKNNKTPLEIKCDKGHIFISNWSAIQRGVKCPNCSGNKKFTLDSIKEFVKKENYEVVSTTYKNNYTKLKFICDKGHRFEMSWKSFHNLNRRCPQCKD